MHFTTLIQKLSMAGIQVRGGEVLAAIRTQIKREAPALLDERVGASTLGAVLFIADDLEQYAESQVPLDARRPTVLARLGHSFDPRAWEDGCELVRSRRIG